MAKRYPTPSKLKILFELEVPFGQGLTLQSCTKFSRIFKAPPPPPPPLLPAWYSSLRTCLCSGLSGKFLREAESPIAAPHSWMTLVLCCLHWNIPRRSRTSRDVEAQFPDDEPGFPDESNAVRQKALALLWALCLRERGVRTNC